MKVLFAPDWQQGVPYQSLLAQALTERGIDIEFPNGSRRGLPLYRFVTCQPGDLLHLHWPEAYWTWSHDWRRPLRRARFPIDFTLARLQQPIVYTAHNLWPHNEGRPLTVRNAVSTTLGLSNHIIVHSHAALEELLATGLADAERCSVIAHGDLSVDLGEPVPRDQARRLLQLERSRPLALMFGRVEPYKGIDEILTWWNRARPDVQLVIAGASAKADYCRKLTQLASTNPNVTLALGHLPTPQLRLWLCAADVCLFNYRQIFTSGAASLTRSYGVPLLLPRRLRTLALGEPSPCVQRFTSMEDDFAQALARALAVKPDYAAARGWRESISWKSIAAKTEQAYRQACGHSY